MAYLINKKNEDFSSSQEAVREFGLTSYEQKIKQGNYEGEYSRFAQLIPNQITAGPINKKFNLLKKPEMDDGMVELSKKAILASVQLNQSRDDEGLVFVNDRQIPGIFQGFRIQGGVYVERFDQTKHRIDLPGIPKGAKLFQADKGLKPYKGSASFLMLDDLWSSALQKCTEFVRIVTDWSQGPEEYLNFKRVFKLSSFLVGADAPFYFEAVKITNYYADMPTGIAGRIMCSFDYEQFEIFSGEAVLRKPDTAAMADENDQAEMEELQNPFTVAPDPVGAA